MDPSSIIQNQGPCLNSPVAFMKPLHEDKRTSTLLFGWKWSRHWAEMTDIQHVDSEHLANNIYRQVELYAKRQRLRRQNFLRAPLTVFHIRTNQ